LEVGLGSKLLADVGFGVAGPEEHLQYRSVRLRKVVGDKTESVEQLGRWVLTRVIKDELVKFTGISPVLTHGPTGLRPSPGASLGSPSTTPVAACPRPYQYGPTTP
jgi:hypothetical protein